MWLTLNVDLGLYTVLTNVSEEPSASIFRVNIEPRFLQNDG
jgi:hypothetical protein